MYFRTFLTIVPEKHYTLKINAEFKSFLQNKIKLKKKTRSLFGFKYRSLIHKKPGNVKELFDTVNLIAKVKFRIKTGQLEIKKRL